MLKVMGPIVLLTDFGESDGYAGVMKGVIAGIAPEARVVDLTHHIPPQDLDAARFVLWNQHRYFPDGSIFVCVVDPGVGSDRKIIAAKTDRHVFLAPDNGLLDYVLSETRAHTILQVENPAFFRTEAPSHTFHGRDVFAPAAAHLVAGELYTQLGPFHTYRVPASPFREAEEGIPGRVVHADHFGNLITSFRQSSWQPAGAEVDGRFIPVASTYAAVQPGELLLLPASHGLWEIACRNGSALKAFGGNKPESVRLV